MLFWLFWYVDMWFWYDIRYVALINVVSICWYVNMWFWYDIRYVALINVVLDMLICWYVVLIWYQICCFDIIWFGLICPLKAKVLFWYDMILKSKVWYLLFFDMLIRLICCFNMIPDMFTLFFTLTAGGEDDVPNFCWTGATGGGLNRLKFGT